MQLVILFLGSLYVGLRFVSLPIGGIWLLAIGEWKWALAAVAFYFIAARFLGESVLFPVGLFRIVVREAMVRNSRLVVRFVSVVWHMYLAVVMSVFTYVVLTLTKDDGNVWYRIPFLLALYLPALSPWGSLVRAQRVGGALESLVILLHVAYVSGAIAIIMRGVDTFAVFLAFSIPFFAGLVFSLTRAWRDPAPILVCPEEE